MVNATGWSQLFEGHPISAVYDMYNIAFGGTETVAGWFILFLFVIGQIMLYSKSKNATLTWTVGVIFTAIYVIQQKFIMASSIYVMFLILTFELAGIIYYLVMK